MLGAYCYRYRMLTIDTRIPPNPGDRQAYWHCLNSCSHPKPLPSLVIHTTYPWSLEPEVEAGARNAVIFLIFLIHGQSDAVHASRLQLEGVLMFQDFWHG
jgi:hypothetical protein